MLWVVLLSSSLLIIILIGVLVMAFHIKNYVQKREEDNQKRFEELKERIDETQQLFRSEVTAALRALKDVIK